SLRAATRSRALYTFPYTALFRSLFEAEARRTYPPEGRLVDVGGGRRIQIDCRGEGGPTVVFQSGGDLLGSLAWKPVMEKVAPETDRKSTRLNSSHVKISYAVFCL